MLGGMQWSGSELRWQQGDLQSIERTPLRLGFILTQSIFKIEDWTAVLEWTHGGHTSYFSSSKLGGAEPWSSHLDDSYSLQERMLPSAVRYHGWLLSLCSQGSSDDVLDRTVVLSMQNMERTPFLFLTCICWQWFCSNRRTSFIFLLVFKFKCTFFL